MIGVLLAVIPLAMVDSLNPASITIAVCLTVVDRPVPALRANIAAVYITYFLIAVAVTLGPGNAIRDVIGHHSSTAVQMTALLSGLLLIAVSVLLWRHRGRSSDAPEPHAGIGRRGAALLGVLGTIADIPTAAPLIAAIALIEHTHLSVVSALVIFAVYCEIYTLPLQAVLAIHVRMGRAGHHLIVAMRWRVERWAPVVLSAFCLVIGFALITDALLPLLG
jgi:cytochrome c biogenesis protein CcdA